MSIVLQSSGGGQITIQEPATASNFTQTLPAATGDVMVSGNMPAFSATNSGSQTSLTSGTRYKVSLQTENFDTNNCFDSTTNYRFTPTVAGYYQFSWSVDIIGTTLINCIGILYKNGSQIATGQLTAAGGSETIAVGSSLIYMNGSTDYAELYALSSSTGNWAIGSGTSVFFTGALVRNA